MSDLRSSDTRMRFEHGQTRGWRKATSAVFETSGRMSSAGRLHARVMTSSMASAISARQSGVEKRWSASLTSVRRISGPVRVVQQPQRDRRAAHRCPPCLAAAAPGTAGAGASRSTRLLPPVLDQAAGDRIGRRRHSRRGGRTGPSFSKVGAFGGGELGSHMLSSVKSGAAAMPTKPATRSGMRAGQQQRDPAAHRRADQHLRAFGQRVDHRQRILGPVADGAVLESRRDDWPWPE